MEVLLQNISIWMMVIIPMMILLAIALNIIKSHTIAVITIIWSILFAFINVSSLLQSIDSSMKSYLLWFDLLRSFNMDAWLCVIYYILIVVAVIKTIYRTIDEFRN